MHTPLRFSFLLVFLLGAPSLAVAQPSERVDRGVTGSGDGATVVWLTPRVAYAREILLSVCWRDRCARVVARQPCDSPDCPAPGWRVATREDLAEVPRWGASEWVAEMTPVLNDPRGERLLDGLAIRPPIPRASARVGTGRVRFEEQIDAIPNATEEVDCEQWCGPGIACHRLAPDPGPEARAQLVCEEGQLVTTLVWISPTTALSRDRIDEACFGERCAPVLEATYCAPPVCPGEGLRIQVATAIADVAPWPVDRAEADRAAARLRADPRALTLGLMTRTEWTDMETARARQSQPDPGLDSHMLGGRSESWGWEHRRRPTLSLEIAAGFTMGSYASGGGVWAGASLSTALQFELETHGSDDGYRVLEAFLFDGAGLRVQASALSRIDGPNQGDWLVSVGAGIVLSNRLSPTGFRLPTLLGALVPEVGTVFRNDLDASAYLAWSLPFSWVLLPHFGIDLRPRVQVVFPPDDTLGDAEVLIGLTVGFIAPMLGSTELRFGSHGSGLVR